MRLRLGTRGSPLALAQATWVEARLKELEPGLEVERVVITTSGDRFAKDHPSEGLSPAFDKGLFVKEIEEALLDRRVDLAVHSCKDLPGVLPPGLTIGAFPARESPRDVLVPRRGPGLAGLAQGARVATTSLRRSVQLRRLRPDLKIVSIRGNVDTRLRKLEAGECDAIVLAEAGLKRLGLEVEREALDIVPAPGQGALAIECREGGEAILRVIGRLDDPRTRLEVEAEREFLLAMEGGCRTPLGAFAESEGGWLRLSVFWSDPEGKSPVRLSGRTKAEPDKVARTVAELAARVKEAALKS